MFLSKKLALERKSIFYFVYLPSRIYYFKDNRFPEKSLYFDQIKSIAEKLNINFIDILVFEKEKIQKNFSRLKCHNEEGYKKVAETIYNFTKD